LIASGLETVGGDAKKQSLRTFLLQKRAKKSWTFLTVNRGASTLLSMMKVKAAHRIALEDGAGINPILQGTEALKDCQNQ
jgi:hypothetical protein